MKKIIHFHPNGNYAKKFINPLQKAEIKLGFKSIVINDVNSIDESLKLDYVIKRNNLFKFPFNFIILILFIHRHKPQIVFCHNSVVAWVPMLAARLVFVKNIIYFNHGIPYLGHKGLIRFILYLIEIVNCFLATQVVSVSHGMKDQLENITKKSISLIHNGSASGIDLNQFVKSKTNIRILKKQYNIDLNNKIILFVGRPNRRKGFNDIIEIWRKYFEFKSDYTLILLGISKTDLLKLLNKIPNNVKAMSFIDKPEIFFIMADYLFVCSYHEGLNYAVLEAFLSKTIVISNNILGVSEIILHKHNGFLINDNRHRLFFEAVMLCESSKLLKDKIFKNSLHIVKRYNRINFLKSYRSFLNQID